METGFFIDSHAHLDGPEFDADRDQVIQRARDAGVRAILNVGTGDPHSGSLERAIHLAEINADIYAAIGTHPHDAKLFDREAEARIERLCTESRRVIALGEIGLDYYYEHSPRDVQRSVFARQLNLAKERELPVIIHTRDADDDTIEVLTREYGDNSRGGIMHCFSGSMRLAEVAMGLNFLVSFSGNVTFKKADEIRSVASRIPLDRILIETDCPYLTPVPFRGKRNEPARVLDVARALAQIRELEYREFGELTAGNFSKLFRLPALAHESARNSERADSNY